MAIDPAAAGSITPGKRIGCYAEDTPTRLALIARIVGMPSGRSPLPGFAIAVSYLEDKLHPRRCGTRAKLTVGSTPDQNARWEDRIITIETPLLK